MGALADIWAAVRLQLDGTGFEAQATALATKGGQNAGDKMSAQLNKKLKMAVGAGVGLAVGEALNSTVAFAAFEKRMDEVFTLLPDLSESAMGKMTENVKAFARETGRTTDEVIPALYQAISAGVPPDNVFDFLRVANKGATAGVASTADEVGLLTAVTKGFGDVSQEAVEKAADLAQLQVKLGQTTIPELAASYGKAVPLASALGVSQEELAAASASLFGVTGNTAEVMTQLKGTFTALITQNPTLTAGLKEMGFATSQEAIESIGLRATLEGLQKATGGSTQELQAMLGSSEAVTAALALTGAQADTFSANLEAMGKSGGTVDTAFKRMDSGAEATARKWAATMETMAIDLGGFINKFGPLPLILAQTFGPGLSRAIGAGLGGLSGILIPRVTAAVLATGPGAAIAGSGVGTAIGTAMGAAIPFALAAGLGLAIALAFKAIVLDPGLQQQTRDIGTAVGEQIATGATDQLEQSKAAIEQGITDINNLPLGGFLYGDQVRDLTAQLDAVNAEIATRAAKGGETVGAAATEGVAAGIEQTTPVVEIAVADLVATLGTSMRGVLDAAKLTGADGMLAMASGITAARAKPLDAFDALKTMLKNALSPMGEIARLHGQLTSKELARGLKSGDPAVRAQAVAVAKAAAARLGELAGAGGKSGKAAMAELDKGIRSKIPAVRAASEAAKGAAVHELNKTEAAAGEAGAAAGTAFAARLRASTKEVILWVNAQGGNIGLVPVASHSSGTPYVPRDMLSLVHRGEIIVPAAASDAIRSGRATLSAGGPAAGAAGHTFNIHNPVPERASESVPRALANLAFLGSGA